MKTLRLLVAVGLLIGSYTVGMAQSNADSKDFKSEAEKKAWVEAQSQVKPQVQERAVQVNNSERFASEEDKQAWLDAQQALLDAKKEANPVKVSTEKRTWAGQNHAGLKAAHTVKSTEKFASEEEKKAWLESNKK